MLGDRISVLLVVLFCFSFFFFLEIGNLEVRDHFEHWGYGVNLNKI